MPTQPLCHCLCVIFHRTLVDGCELEARIERDEPAVVAAVREHIAEPLCNACASAIADVLPRAA